MIGKIKDLRYLKKKRKGERGKLIKELDKWFSLYIRLRDANSNGMVRCFTSGKLMYYKKAQAGHYISRRYFPTRWDEKNVQVQSVGENMFNQGNAPVFGQKLNEKYGPGTTDMLLIKKGNRFKVAEFEMRHMISDYKKRVKELLKNINLE